MRILERRARAVPYVLLAVGLAVMSAGLRPARADGPGPIAPPVRAGAPIPGTAAVSASVAAGSSAGVSASLGATSSGQPSVSLGVATGVGGGAAIRTVVSTNDVGLVVPPGSSGSIAQLSGRYLSGAETSAAVVDPVFGLTAGSAVVADPPGPGTSAEATQTTGRVRVTTQDAPVICSQLVFRPLVAGCQALLGPIGGGGLAPTGTPLVTSLVGVLLILVGATLTWRSRRRGGGVTGTLDASRVRRTTPIDA